jgi:hemerythrin-like domain-containing protein
MAHQVMRAANEQLLTAVTAMGERDWRRANALARWFEGYAGELRHHHMVEDDIFFPALAERAPELRPLIDELGRDHEHLDEILDGLTTTLGTLAQGRSTWMPDQQAAIALAAELRDLLAPHLDIEDRDIVGEFAERFSVEEYDKLDSLVLKTMSLRQMLFTVPWFAATVPAERAAEELQAAPMPVRVIYRLTRRRYARLVARGFAPR